MMLILFRACDINQVHLDSTRIVQPKGECIIRCLRSLLYSVIMAQKKMLTENFRVIILNDRCTDYTLERIQSTIAHVAADVACSIEKVIILPGLTGNGSSLHLAYHRAKEITHRPSDLIYFCEDDYLHQPSAISEALSSYYLFKKNLGNNVEVGIHLNDDPNNYDPDSVSRKNSFVVLGEKRHWRTNNYTTGSFICTREIVTRYWDALMRLTKYGSDPEIHENNTISAIWREPEGARLFTPIPTLAWHLQFERNIAPFTDYLAVWARYSDSRWEGL